MSDFSNPEQRSNGPAAQTSSPLVVLRRATGHIPLVLIAGEAGLADAFQPLAHLLGDDQPLYGLHSVAANLERDPGPSTIEEIAARHLPHLAALDPGAPVVLGGFGVGALVAFELALQMGEAGRSVPLLISLDGYAPGSPKRLPFHERLEIHVRELRQRGPRARLEYARSRLDRFKQQLRGEPHDHAWEPLHSSPPGIEPRLRAIDAVLQSARERYATTARAHCDLLLVRASVSVDAPGRRIEPLYGWRSYVTGRIETIRLPGSHAQLLRAANRALLADILSRRLSELNQRERRAGRA